MDQLIGDWQITIDADQNVSFPNVDGMAAVLVQILQQFSVDLPNAVNLDLPGVLDVSLKYSAEGAEQAIVRDERTLTEHMTDLAAAAMQNGSTEAMQERLEYGQLELAVTFSPQLAQMLDGSSAADEKKFDHHLQPGDYSQMLDDDERSYKIDIPFVAKYDQEIWDEIRNLPHYQQRLDLIREVEPQLSEPLSAYFYDIIPPNDRPSEVIPPKRGGSRIAFENLVQQLFILPYRGEVMDLSREFAGFLVDLADKLESATDPAMRLYYEQLFDDAKTVDAAIDAFWPSLPRRSQGPNVDGISNPEVIPPHGAPDRKNSR